MVYAALSGSSFRFKKLAAFINDIPRDFPALALAVLFKPRASPEQGSTSEIIIFDKLVKSRIR